jgi:hypothetical protein
MWWRGRLLKGRSYVTDILWKRMKITKVAFLALVLALVNLVAEGSATTDRVQIVPGARLGGVALGPDGAKELNKLPRPYRVDRGMSQTRQVWKWTGSGGRLATLFIHTVNNGVIDAQPANGFTIDLIRGTAPGWRTANGISVGSSLAQIRTKFPAATRVENSPAVYDDVKEGIAFEFANQPAASSPCIAIMVHVPGQGRIADQKQVDELLKNGASQ